MDWFITSVAIVMVVLMIIAMIKSEHAGPMGVSCGSATR